MLKRKIRLNKDVDVEGGLVKGRVMVPDSGGDHNVRRTPVKVVSKTGVLVLLNPFDFDFVDESEEKKYECNTV